MAYNETLQQKVIEFMSEQDKLELYFDYNDYLEWDQVREFIDFCEENIKDYDLKDWITDSICEALLFDYFDNNDNWLRDYMSESFYSHFRAPFEEIYWEEEWYDDCEADELLWNEMYEQDKFDANMKHFDSKHHFYILIDPENSFYQTEKLKGWWCVWTYKFDWPYMKSLMRSQWWTKGSYSYSDLTAEAWSYCWICVMHNCNLFDFIRLIVADKLTVKKGSDIFLFDPFNWSGWTDVTLEKDRSFKIKDKKVIWYGCDDAKKWPFGYTPNTVYGFVHSYYDKNIVLNY